MIWRRLIPVGTGLAVLAASTVVAAQDRNIGGLALREAMPATLTEPATLSGSGAPPTDQVLLLVVRLDVGHAPFGGMGRPDPIWFVNDMPVGFLAFDPPDAVLVVPLPEDPRQAVLWRYDPAAEAAPRAAMPGPDRIRQLSVEAQRGVRPALRLGDALIEAPRNRVALEELSALARRRIEGR